MALFLEITEGSDKGQRYRLNEGLQIGRTQGSVRLNDTKVSGLHAQVEIDQKGQLILVDMDSFNGLIINGQKVKRIAMMPGVSFQIGKTFFRVVRLFEENTSFRQELANLDWKERIALAMEKIQVPLNSNTPKIQVFPHTVELVVTAGIQANTTFTLGYGPRKIGSQSLDIELQEPQCPAFAFEIEPSGSDVIFKTAFSDQVLLNGTSTSTQILSSGDRIYIANTVIEVRFTI